ncbi:disulfide bond formation protein B [Komagataeibacter sucrofermentans]|uniref:Disulfide bond formation protein B n=2 Tax=Komagataeibacter sucrofermentans TaxID=1053551 RepID=A0A318QYB3_9PROT|nr:disulfide bond formation protein B [Komagataeibacter sucrofermentans]PYD78003.1 disulfide bond formation protein B [Komagataeibacter sucrofermentans]
MRSTALLMVLAGCAALGVAWWSEYTLGHVPCGLCLWERWPYRVLAGLGLLGLVLPRDAARGALWLCMPVLLVAAFLGGLHVGVEQGWWPSPLPECRAPTFHGGSFAQRLASMPRRPAKPCDAATYLVPGVPLSMAALGGIYALALIPVVRRGLRIRAKFRGRGRKTIQG